MFLLVQTKARQRLKSGTARLKERRPGEKSRRGSEGRTAKGETIYFYILKSHFDIILWYNIFADIANMVHTLYCR